MGGFSIIYKDNFLVYFAISVIIGVMNIEKFDDKKMYCRMLGHEIGFGYCRLGGSGQACRKVFDCWFETFDIGGFMREHFTEEDIKAILAPPKPKMASLIEMIQEAQKSKDSNAKE